MLLQGGPPPAPPAAPRGAGLSARRLCKIRTHQNVEVCGRSEDETPRKCILQAENIMPGSKKLWEEHLFPSEKIVFSPFGRKNNHFFLRKQKFASEFFCPWHNVSTQKEHIFPHSFAIQNYGELTFPLVLFDSKLWGIIFSPQFWKISYNFVKIVLCKFPLSYQECNWSKDTQCAALR